MNLRHLLFPFSIIFGAIVWVRNLLYDKKVLASKSFKTPIILVGNLSTGGTGKTPHIEYLIRLLSAGKKVTTLSRGYGRNTTGYQVVHNDSTAEACGDEPLLYKFRHPEINVTVCEDRVAGVQHILRDFPDTNVILMDDGYQHRRIQAGCNILLTTWQNPWFKDMLLPAGNLRESAAGKNRADIVIVSRTPENATTSELQQFNQKLQLRPNVPVFFSAIEYGTPIPVGTSAAMSAPDAVLVFTGIADPSEFVKYIAKQYGAPELIRFKDHHNFTAEDISAIRSKFDTLQQQNKNVLILTTEKDAVRLQQAHLKKLVSDLPMYYIPVNIVLADKQKEFEALIYDYVGKNKINR